jgi:hypothetical protein
VQAPLGLGNFPSLSSLPKSLVKNHQYQCIRERAGQIGNSTYGVKLAFHAHKFDWRGFAVNQGRTIGTLMSSNEHDSACALALRSVAESL